MGGYQWLPPEALKILVALFLSFLIGLEREEHKAAAEHYSFGGVRTFPLIGLTGYTIALLCGTQILPLMLGFLVVGSFLLLSYWRKLSMTAETAGVTSEISGLATFLVGALAWYGHFWIATALTVVSLLLLELKEALEKLPRRIPSYEILTFAKFLLLTAVILPIVPREQFGRFHISPFKTWLVVVAVSTISYASYVAQKLTKGRGGASCRVSWRSILLYGDDGRFRSESENCATTSPVCGSHPDGLRGNVFAFTRFARDVQSRLGGEPIDCVSSPGGTRNHRSLVLVPQT